MVRLTQVAHATRRFAPHFYSTFAFGVVESGRCCVMTPRGSWVAGPGSLLAFTPGEVHWAQVLSDEPYSYRVAYLPADYVRALARGEVGALRSAHERLVPISDPSGLSAAFLGAHRALSDDAGSSGTAAHFMTCTRGLLRAAAGTPPLSCSTKALALADAARQVLTLHVGRRVCLESVAEACGVTTFQLIRVFGRVTGLSPYAYLVVLRVNEARRLLDAGATVSDVVHHCCFSDQSHLTRVFKRTLGMPPGLYLRSPRA